MLFLETKTIFRIQNQLEITKLSYFRYFKMAQETVQ